MVHTFHWTSSDFSFIPGFLAESLKARKKSKKYYSIQFRSKDLTHFTKLDFFYIESNMLPKHSQKLFSSLRIFQQTCFCLLSEKTFALHNFLTPKNCFLETFWKQMSVIFLYISLRKILFQRRSKIFPGSMGSGGKLNNFLKAARCSGLVKCFTIFHFNWNFLKFNYFSVFQYLHQ